MSVSASLHKVLELIVVTSETPKVRMMTLSWRRIYRAEGEVAICRKWRSGADQDFAEAPLSNQSLVPIL